MNVSSVKTVNITLSGKEAYHLLEYLRACDSHFIAPAVTNSLIDDMDFNSTDVAFTNSLVNSLRQDLDCICST